MSGRAMRRLAVALGLVVAALAGCVPGLELWLLGGAASGFLGVRSSGPFTAPAQQVSAALRVEPTGQGGFALGDPDAPVSILVFYDFACPHCQTYNREAVIPLIAEQVTAGQARLELYLYPTAGGATSTLAGQVVECADRLRPGMFLSVYHLLYQLAESGNYNDGIATRVANAIDVTPRGMSECARTATGVETSVEYARALGVMGTPTVRARYGGGDPEVIDGKAGGGVPYDVLAEVIAEAQ